MNIIKTLKTELKTKAIVINSYHIKFAEDTDSFRLKYINSKHRDTFSEILNLEEDAALSFGIEPPYFFINKSDIKNITTYKTLNELEKNLQTKKRLSATFYAICGVTVGKLKEIMFQNGDFHHETISLKSGETAFLIYTKSFNMKVIFPILKAIKSNVIEFVSWVKFIKMFS